MAEQSAENSIKKLHNPNIFLSKAEFIEMRAKEKALKARMAEYELKARAEVENEVEEVVEEPNAVQTVATVKKAKGRPKKVVEKV